MKKIIILSLLTASILMSTSCTASMERSVKTMQSNWGGGLDRTVTAYDYNGNVLRTWKGKLDVSESENEITFDLDGKRVIIHGGIVIVEEN